jgi:hypothetical protein
MSPPALSDLQLRLLERAASSLPLSKRAAFAERVMASLRGEPSTPAVEAAIGIVLTSMRPTYATGIR